VKIHNHQKDIKLFIKDMVSFTIITVFMILSLFLIASSLPPTVVFDYETNQCVEVIGGRDGQTCENLPRKYNHKWRM